MALSKQLIGFNFSNGLSTEADATMSAPGTLEKAENVRYLESGALVGREGFVNLGSREHWQAEALTPAMLTQSVRTNT